MNQLNEKLKIRSDAYIYYMLSNLLTDKLNFSIVKKITSFISTAINKRNQIRLFITLNTRK